ncbi:MAG: hypothetical protein M1832_003211 [Thelocarpon impressellum]|nr:MAG: hypothetical protein M1832_003211 [Thelocarpon impressellum]
MTASEIESLYGSVSVAPSKASLADSHSSPPSSAQRRSAHGRGQSMASFINVADGIRRLRERTRNSDRPSSSRARSNTVLTDASLAPDGPARPTSSWHKRAASLALLSRPSSSFFSNTTSPPPPLQRPTASPTSQLGDLQAQDASAAPGAAARAAAAAQNGRLGVGRVVVIQGESKVDRDAESGIGIEVRGSADEGRRGAPDVSVVRRDPVEHLPSEISAYILSFLDHASLCKAERVSKAWNHAAVSHHVWRDVFRNEHNGAWNAAKRGSSPFDTTGRGMGRRAPDQDWKKIFGVRKELRQKWDKGNLAAAYVEGHTDCVYCVQFDDDKFITGSRDRTVRIWDIRTFRTIKVLGQPAATGSDAATGPASQDANIDAGVITVQPSCAQAPAPAASAQSSGSRGAPDTSAMYHDASILCLQFDSEILVTGSSDATCIVWSIPEDYKAVRRLQHHTHGVVDVCIDRQRIVTCSKDTTVCVWDRQTGELLRQMSGHIGPVNAIQMRGNLVVSTSGDALIKLWNLDSGRCVREFAGHTRGLACVQFSEDSRLIVSGGNDHVIRVWDANTGECIRELHGHRSLVRSLHLDSANGRVISGSYDQSVKVFDLETGALLIDFPKWTTTWILCAKADYRRIIATSQCGRTFIMDFGKFVDGVELLEDGPASRGSRRSSKPRSPTS